MTHPIPDEALAQHMAVVGRTGSGKTFLAKGLVERLLDQQRRVVVIDPTGAWWGLRSNAAGDGAGYSVAVFGGERADVPIAETSGPRLAEILGTRNLPAVIDLSEMLIGARHRFVEHFLEALHRFNRAPLHLVIDEADEVAPQNPMPETKRLLHQVDRVVRRGRIRGFRVMMITQRPAVIHKNVLSQANTLVAMRLTAPQDRKAIDEWVKGNADAGEAKAVLDSLARLGRGEGWVWAPELGILKRAKFPPIRTFDSSRSPEDGESVAEPVNLAHVDLAEIRAELAPVDETAKPAGKVVHPTAAQLKATREEGYKAGHAAGYEEGRAVGWNVAIGDLQGLILELRKRSPDGQRNHPDAGVAQPVEHRASKAKVAGSSPAVRSTTRLNQGHSVGQSPADMTKAERAFLTVLAQRDKALSRKQLAVFAGYAPGSGGVGQTLASLRAKGWIGGDGSAIELADAGRKALGSYEPLPTGKALRDYWISRLPTAAATFLSILCDVHPQSLSRTELAERAGYAPGSGGVGQALAAIRKYELAVGPGTAIKASEDLFDGR